MGFLTPKMPQPPSVPMPPPAAHPATLGSAQIQLAQGNSKGGGQGFDNTLKTSPGGLEAPKTAKTLLG